MKKFALIGNPIKHSLSPFIHQSFAKQCQINLDYKTIAAASVEAFLHEVKSFFSQASAVGMNVTVPFKAEAFRLIMAENNYVDNNFTNNKPVDNKSTLHLGQSINTLWLDVNQQGHERLVGTSTDGYGLVKDLTQNLKMDLSGKSILLVGAGGAASGVLADLILANPACIHITNRTYDTARHLVERFAHVQADTELGSLSIEALQEPLYDLIINATSISLHHQEILFPASIVKHAVVYDMAYDLTQPTHFNQWAKKHQAAEVFDGIGMLVEQAAESFRIWHGVSPDTHSVLNDMSNSN